MAGRREKELFLLLSVCSLLQLGLTVCEGDGGQPAFCSPPPQEDLLEGLEPVASDTCGQRGPERFCYQTREGETECELCDARSEGSAHSPSFMTDRDSDTFWLSRSPTVIITFPLRKTFQISRFSVSFRFSTPESFAIFKSTDNGKSFVPFRYFSLSCGETYGVQEGDSSAPLCSSPGEDGEIVFDPLEQLPTNGASQQRWDLATHLQLQLDSFSEGGEFYSISEVDLSGTCHCNGHAATCSGSVAGGDVECVCEHGTTGPDCTECLEFYQDSPWVAATPENPATCAACNCNNHSEVCRFDMERYLASGGVSGGVCEACRDNTEGPHCQQCRFGYYPDTELPLTSPNYCSLCECDPSGTEGGADSCLPSPFISPAGPARQSSCQCKENVRGERCSVCNTGYHQLNISNPAGCDACPACYDQVALEFNKTQTLLSSLLSSISSSPTDLLPADLLREIRDYQVIVEDMLQRATNLLSRERNLTARVEMVSMETDEAEDLIGRLEENVTLSEEGVARIRAESGVAGELLVRLRESVEAVEMALRIDLLASLSRARETLQEIERLFSELMATSLAANSTSAAQYDLALELLSSATNSSIAAMEALDLLSVTLSLHNSTSALVVELQGQRASLDATFIDASSDLNEARVSVSFAVRESRNLLERLRNTSIAEYDTEDLEARLEALRGLTVELESATATVSSELEGVEGEVGLVRERAAVLLEESAILNLLAVELLGRAHAALSFANQTVEEGNRFVAGVEVTLRQLQMRLENSSGFVSGLEEVVSNVLLAEELVSEAEREGERRSQEVREAVERAEEAVEAFEQASQLSIQALELALRVRDRARGALFNATLLASQAEDLAGNVTVAEDRGAELEGVAMETAELITMATEVAQSASSDARSLQEETEQLLGILGQLQVDLNSTELLPGNQLSEVGAMVTELEAQADSNQLTLDALQDQVGQLEESEEELRERHQSLQQHRDLLQSLLDNIQPLDCRNQFQSI